MATAAKTKKEGTAKRRQPEVTQNGETPKRLSKIGQWMLDNPEGIIIVHDRRAVNR
jgi:uncharacterized phage-like protein YoqJ